MSHFLSSGVNFELNTVVSLYLSVLDTESIMFDGLYLNPVTSVT